MTHPLQEKLSIPYDRLDEINELLINPDTAILEDFLSVIDKYGSPEEINQKAHEAGQLPVLLDRIRHTQPEYLEALVWLEAKRDEGAFISIPEYRRNVLGDDIDHVNFNEEYPVTLEVSALQYFPYLIAAAEKVIQERSLMPGRFIKVRNMKEQESDGDLAAIAAAMQIIGASYVETLDTKGTDGSNIHLGGPATITGYFGGVGQPNHYPLKWLDEYLYYYTNYGVRQVLNINSGTVLVGYLLHKLGVDIEFKISVFMGNDNPYAALWTLIGAKLFSRNDGSSPLIGFNWSNSVNNQTLELTAQFRNALNFEKVVRFEHHITETWKSIVRQPYNRREELIEIASRVANISAKHEGGDPDIDQLRAHPSDILDYFRSKDEVIASGEWELLLVNFLDKVDAANRTGWALTQHGLSFIAASNLHSSKMRIAM
jgi:hypothetical protein